jgi:hypothetical protein
MVLPVHLLVCSHGLWGEPDHMATIAQIILETYLAQEYPECELEVLIAETNRSVYTYDGIGGSFTRQVRAARLTRDIMQIGAASGLSRRSAIFAECSANRFGSLNKFTFRHYRSRKRLGLSRAMPERRSESFPSLATASVGYSVSPCSNCHLSRNTSSLSLFQLVIS